jgi:hypothetical protein
LNLDFPLPTSPEGERKRSYHFTTREGLGGPSFIGTIAGSF